MASPVRELLVPPLTRTGIPLGGRQRGQERLSLNASRKGDFGQQHADALRDVVRDYVVEHFSDDDAVLVIDETGFLKQGRASCGVARQYTGSAGKITNCQIGVFAAYVSRVSAQPGASTDCPDKVILTA